MAWIVWKGRIAHVQWRDRTTGRVRSRSARTMDPATAEIERARVEREDEGRESGARGTMDPRQALARWLGHLRALGRSVGTVTGYEDKVGVVVAALEGRPWASWTAPAVVAAILSRPGWGPATRCAALVQTAAWLRWCEAARVGLPRGIADAVRDEPRPTVRVVDRDVLSEAEIVALVARARGTYLEAAVALAGLAGLALGDLVALRADELDLAAGTMHRRAGRAKTGERYRVPLAPAVVAAVRPHLRRSGLALDLPPVRQMARDLAALTDSAGVRRGRGDGWHRLRHSFGTILGRRRVPLATIRRLMGHAPGSTVTLRYLHDDEDTARDAVAGLGGGATP